MSTVPVVETPRLRLRAWRASDRDTLAALLSDPEVVRYLTGVPFTREESDAAFERRLGHWRDLGFGFWVVERKDTGAMIGWAGLQPADHFAGWKDDVEVGWTLARPSWGLGLATEAGAASLRHGFERLGLARIAAFRDPANTASGHVMEKLGMEPAGFTTDDKGRRVAVRSISCERWCACAGEA